MKTAIISAISKRFSDWTAEDSGMEAQVRILQDWMQQVSQLGIPHFGETAGYLRQLRGRLNQHFDREGIILADLQNLLPASSPHADVLRCQSRLDHNELLETVDDLIARLDQLDPPFQSWQAAIGEVEQFVGQLQEHEAKETQQIQVLLDALVSTTLPASEAAASGAGEEVPHRKAK